MLFSARVAGSPVEDTSSQQPPLQTPNSRITSARNPNKINNLHTLKTHPSATHRKQAPYALFGKHGGGIPPKSTSKILREGTRRVERSEKLWLGGGGIGRGRELGDADDHLAGFGALQFFASDSLDRVGIGFQGFDLIAELDVFGVEAVDVFADFPDFDLSVAHRDKSVRAKNVVDDEREDEQTKNCTAMQLQKIADLVFYRLCHVARTHFVASSVNFADAFELSAST